MKKVLGFILLALIFPAIWIYRFFGGHWCQDETNMLIMSVPFAGAAWAWLRARLHHKQAHKDCEHEHKGG